MLPCLLIHGAKPSHSLSVSHHALVCHNARGVDQSSRHFIIVPERVPHGALEGALARLSVLPCRLVLGFLGVFNDVVMVREGCLISFFRRS